MAFVNPNKPAGLSPIMTLSGSDWTGKGSVYSIPTSDSTNAYYVGDVVTLIAGGGGDANGYPNVVLATAGAASVGVVVAAGINPLGGPYINPNDLSKTFVPATKAVPYYVLVVDDPNMIFEVQESGAGTNLAATTAPGRNANFVYAAPATGVAVSGTTLNNVGLAVTATLNLKILRLAPRP